VLHRQEAVRGAVLPRKDIFARAVDFFLGLPTLLSYNKDNKGVCECTLQPPDGFWQQAEIDVDRPKKRKERKQENEEKQGIHTD
jgi:hypothetical protein